MPVDRRRAAEFGFFDSAFVALAHRGGSKHPENQGRENSMHAFETAVRLGYTHLETDVHVTSDGELIAFHDERLERTTDGTGCVAELPWSAVSSARIGGHDPVSRLGELLEAFPQHFFNIDIKAPGAVEPLYATLKAHAAFDRVCVGSFGARRLRRFRRLAGPTVATAVSGPGILWNRFGGALSALINSPGQALQLPVRWSIAGRDTVLIGPPLIRAAHRAGKQVHVWTIDDEAQMEELIDLGVDGLVSDNIAGLKRVLQRRGLWRDPQE